MWQWTVQRPLTRTQTPVSRFWAALPGRQTVAGSSHLPDTQAGVGPPEAERVGEGDASVRGGQLLRLQGDVIQVPRPSCVQVVQIQRGWSHALWTSRAKGKVKKSNLFFPSRLTYFFYKGEGKGVVWARFKICTASNQPNQSARLEQTWQQNCWVNQKLVRAQKLPADVASVSPSSGRPQ